MMNREITAETTELIRELTAAIKVLKILISEVLVERKYQSCMRIGEVINQDYPFQRTEFSEKGLRTLLLVKE